MSEPRPPKNVRIIYEDGTRVPVDCIYTGMKDGCAMWQVITEVDRSQIRSVEIDMLPAKTEVRM